MPLGNVSDMDGTVCLSRFKPDFWHVNHPISELIDYFWNSGFDLYEGPDNRQVESSRQSLRKWSQIPLADISKKSNGENF